MYMYVYTHFFFYSPTSIHVATPNATIQAGWLELLH